MSLTDTERAAIDAANATGRRPVMFIHGLWLLASSWAHWADVFEEAGYAAVAPGWPDDPETVEEARKDPSAFAGKSVGQISDHYSEAAQALDQKPVVIGHSFGGLLTEIVAGRGLAAASVPISPAPARGVLPLPIAQLRSAMPVLGNPLNFGRAVALTQGQFRYGFGNAVSQEESDALYEQYHVAGPGKVIFQAATGNLNPFTETKADAEHPERGPMLVIGAKLDHTVPAVVAKASFKREAKNEAVTEYHEFEDRGHSLTIDARWREVADVALAFVTKVAPA